MGSSGLRNLPFVSRPPEAARERAEPRLVAAMPVSRRPAELRATEGRPGEANPEPLTNLRNNGPRLGVAPVVSAADRQPVSSGKQETNSRRSIALAAVAALAIGAVGAIAGTGLLSTAPSEKKTIATAAPPDDANPSGTDRGVALVPAPATTPRPVAAGVPGISGGNNTRQSRCRQKPLQRGSTRHCRLRQPSRYPLRPARLPKSPSTSLNRPPSQKSLLSRPRQKEKPSPNRVLYGCCQRRAAPPTRKSPAITPIPGPRARCDR